MTLKLLQLVANEDFKGRIDRYAFRTLVADCIPATAPAGAYRLLDEIGTVYHLMREAYAEHDLDIADANRNVLLGLLNDLHDISRKMN